MIKNKQIRFAVGLFIIISVFGLLFTSRTEAQSTPSIYWGAYIRGFAGNPTYPTDYTDCPWDGRTCDRFETNAGKKVSIIHFGSAWKNSSGSFIPFPAGTLDLIRNRGTIPMLGWGSWQQGKGVNQPDFKLTNITRGDYDAYLTQWALDAKAWVHPFFLRFDHEMNIGGQFSWNFSDTWTNPATGTTYKNTSDDYINMWRHVVNIFKSVGANNVTWVWCPNIYYRSGSKALPFMQAYPGDAYVDWNCFDGYNKSSTSMTPFSALFSDSYNVMQQKVSGTDTQCSSITLGCNPKTKPIMIGEWASTEAGDGGTKKANWEKDALLTQIPNNFPAIKAAVWFNWNSDPNQIIESTSVALAGFKSAIANPIYSVNGFGNLPVGTKVLPLDSLTTPSPTLRPNPSPVNKLGDINGDGVVDIIDIGVIIDNYGKVPINNIKADVNRDGTVDIIDVGIVIDNYGR